MTYFVSLKITAIIVGLLVLAGHLPGAIAPERIGPVLKKLTRNYPLGVVLMLAATAWLTILTGVMDLGEISSARTQLMVLWVAAGALVAIFVPGYLPMRGLGCLLLLAAALVLDAAFLVLTPWAYVIKLMAYVWVIAGMVLVYSPHLGRDAVFYAMATPQRARMFAWPGVIFGVLVIALGIFVYP